MTIDKAQRLCSCIETLNESYQALIVGGAVRDQFTHRECHDIDLATNAPIEVLEHVFETHDIGKSKDFGIVVIVFEGDAFEVAQFRVDGKYSDNRRPDSVEIGSLTDDAERRDFTINALYMDKHGAILDFHDGICDIRGQYIRAIGDPTARFEEDALRIIRALRFAAIFNFRIEPETMDALLKLKDTILNVANERIRDEIIKVANEGDALARFIELADRTEILELILPELAALKDCPEFEGHHPEGRNSFEHTLAAVRASRSFDPIANLAILFHDLGKAVAKTINRSGTGFAYYGHDVKGEKVLDAVCDRLKFKNDHRDAMKFAMLNHMIAHRIMEVKKSKLLPIIHSKYYTLLLEVVWADDSCRGGPLFDKEEFFTRMKRLDDIEKQYKEKAVLDAKLKGLIDGKLIIDRCPGIEGKDIGRIKKEVTEEIIEGDFALTADEVKDRIDELFNGDS
jgi:tRNA nucleotidyltransferase (CCA-adding enzyme)